MSDPRLQDGSAGIEPRSARTPNDIRQKLYASLTSACLALDELEHVGIKDFRNDEEYVTKVGRLVGPIFAFNPAFATTQTSCECPLPSDWYSESFYQAQIRVKGMLDY